MKDNFAETEILTKVETEDAIIPYNLQVFLGGASVAGGSGLAVPILYYGAATGAAIAGLATAGVFVVIGACALAYKMKWNAEEKIEFVKRKMTDDYDKRQRYKIFNE